MDGLRSSIIFKVIDEELANEDEVRAERVSWNKIHWGRSVSLQTLKGNS